MTRLQEALAELERLMPVDSDGDWGPQFIVCRWCRCWLAYSDASPGKPDETHDPSCFAVRVLKRPVAKGRSR